MPRKCIRKNIKEKNRIATRLIQISMKVDDLIYRNLPISLENAQSNLREVSGYKTLCQKDPRSSQVIEKLTRILEKIIADAGGACTVNVVDSPKVTQQTIPIVLTTLNEKQTPQSLEVPKTTDKINDKSTIVTDLCDEIKNSIKKDDLNYPANNDMDVDMQKAISNLSLNDIQSQSIIGNFSQHIIATQAITSATDITKANNNLTLTNTNINTDPDIKNSKASKKDKKIEKKKVPKKSFKPPVIAKKSKNATIKQNKVIITNATNSDTVANNNNIGIHYPITKSLDTQPLPPKPASKNVKICPTSRSTQSNKQDATKRNILTPKNSNSSIENDLSWVENIRFVREVTNDEHDPKLSTLSEHFWDNLETPRLFAEQDFAV